MPLFGIGFPLFYCKDLRMKVAKGDSVLEEAVLRNVKLLACLEPSREEMDRLGPELEKMTGFFRMMEKLKTDGVEPLVQLTGDEEPSAGDGEGNAFREDKVQSFDCVEEMLSGAPNREGSFFVVPKTF